jgi:hypothetical protein
MEKKTKGTPTTHLQKINKQTTEPLKARISQIRDMTMMKGTSHPKGTSHQ